MSNDIEQYRAGFEAWARDEGLNYDYTEGANSRRYDLYETELAWRAWAAGRREASTGVEKAAARYHWVALHAQREGHDGGWTGSYRLPLVAAWNDTPYASRRGEGFHYPTLEAAIDAAIEARAKCK